MGRCVICAKGDECGLKVIEEVYVRKVGNKGDTNDNLKGEIVRVGNDSYRVIKYSVYLIEEEDVFNKKSLTEFNNFANFEKVYACMNVQAFPRQILTKRGLFGRFMGFVHGGGLANMFCVFNEGALRPSNYLRMASESFKGINDNNQSGEGVYFRFVKDCEEKMFKWSDFFANVCGKGVGGGVIYFMPRIMACGLKFMHASGIDNGGKKVNSFVTVEDDAKMRDTIEGIFKTKKGIKNYPKENQTEIAFNDGVDLNRITDIFVSVSKIKKMRENLKSSLTSYDDIINTCINEKQLNDETKKIIIENYYSGTKNKNYKEVLLNQESVNQESVEQDKEVSYKNKVTELLFDKICPFPTLDNNYYAYKKTKEYYWFATDNGLKITTPDKSNLKKNKLDLNKCIIISWLNRVVDVLGSIVENPEKREEKYEDFKLNSQKEIKNVEKIRTEELESQGSKEDTYCCKNIDDSIPLYIESESEKTKIDSTSSKPKQDNKLVVSK